MAVGLLLDVALLFLSDSLSAIHLPTRHEKYPRIGKNCSSCP